MLASFRASGQQFIPLDNFNNSLGRTSQATGELTASTHGLTAAYHLLHPILSLAGVQLGEFRAFAVLEAAAHDAATTTLCPGTSPPVTCTRPEVSSKIPGVTGTKRRVFPGSTTSTSYPPDA